jgi:DNA mismatch endonuclease (patch repair protein)
MVDRYPPERRSEIMARIRGENTSPEMVVRRLVHGMGYRFRPHRKDLPGKPDIVLPKHRSIIFVHGCFWHQHPGCRRSALPKTRREWWRNKLDGNVARDRSNLEKLAELGWHVLVIWECELKPKDGLVEKLAEFLGRGRASREQTR